MFLRDMSMSVVTMQKRSTGSVKEERTTTSLEDIWEQCNPPIICSRSQSTPDCETPMGAETWPVLTNAIGRSA